MRRLCFVRVWSAVLPSPVSLSPFLFEGNTVRYLLFSRLTFSVSFFLYTFFLLRGVFVCLIRNDRWMMTRLVCTFPHCSAAGAPFSPSANQCLLQQTICYG